MARDKNIDLEIGKLEGEMTGALMNLVSIPAVSPISVGGDEKRKAGFVERICRETGFDEVLHYDAPSPSGPRPNIVARLKGKDARAGRLWVITHLDVVPAGAQNLWQGDPFKPELKNGRIYGRGAEDNGQDLIACLFAVKALKKLGLMPEREICAAVVTDEETLSVYGMKYLISRGLFKKGDFFLVPDGGSPDGSLIEFAEKSLLWLRVDTVGRQSHASMPDKGINAMEAASAFISRLGEVRKKFGKRDRRFQTPASSFEPTRRLENVGNINTIPGTDTFFIDCRILPCYPVSGVLSYLDRLKKRVEKERKVKITIKVVQQEEATVTDPKNHLIQDMAKLVRDVLKVRPKTRGVGWGTCASFVRQAGYPAVVWSKVDGTAHQPNEYASVRNLLDDAVLFAHAFLEL
ncbi:MAG: M20 family metallo-hydrolase [Candidatus Omnitrophota bacterium]